MKLEELNQLPEKEFLAAIGGPLEGEEWLAARVLQSRPFADLDALITAFQSQVQAASLEEKIKLIASHPDLANKLAVLSPSSISEQTAAGLNQLTEAEYAEFSQLNSNYRERFGFPFVICAREHDKASILLNFRQRLNNPREKEIETGTIEVLKILRLRLLDWNK
jgi:2-oxo-4-hydroxy-4-carboxy-5-ureidoimidazoline decarboxylase